VILLTIHGLAQFTAKSPDENEKDQASVFMRPGDLPIPSDQFFVRQDCLDLTRRGSLPKPGARTNPRLTSRAARKQSVGIVYLMGVFSKFLQQLENVR
jgi:hypothetical protein